MQDRQRLGKDNIPNYIVDITMTSDSIPAASAESSGASAPEIVIKPEMRQAIFPGLVVPAGLTFEDLERAGEMIIEWQGDGWSRDPDDEIADDFRAVRLAAKLYEYLRAAVSGRTDTGSGKC
jgi:hypothetical protein